jgi:hypothetical protein
MPKFTLIAAMVLLSASLCKAMEKEGSEFQAILTKPPSIPFSKKPGCFKSCLNKLSDRQKRCLVCGAVTCTCVGFCSGAVSLAILPLVEAISQTVCISFCATTGGCFTIGLCGTATWYTISDI